MSTASDSTNTTPPAGYRRDAIDAGLAAMRAASQGRGRQLKAGAGDRG